MVLTLIFVYGICLNLTIFKAANNALMDVGSVLAINLMTMSPSALNVASAIL